ncbi:hypothetical protein VOI32_37045 [Paraburkholderia caribensis]|uniref:Uncharacterized protein n=1 Tax=Paraburkholderia caribensis TaxID=75105 RepID=A0ABV0EA98_9BURK|nr:hypothetical protein [Paraburkholderia caribensis]MCO4877826.1 hypothetical protein [Paraburkholderia caribensis]
MSQLLREVNKTRLFGSKKPLRVYVKRDNFPIGEANRQSRLILVIGKIDGKELIARQAPLENGK